MGNPGWNESANKIPRNAPCPCGSGKKYKKCCGADPGTSERCASPSSLPEGVTEFCQDEDNVFAQGFPSWRMELDLPDDDEWTGEDTEINKAVKKVIDGFLRPYVERHARIIPYENKRNSPIAILQTGTRPGEKMLICPSVRLADSSQMYDIFRKKLREYFDLFFNSSFVCELSHDMMYGGPILTLEDEEGTKEVFMVAIPKTEG